MPRNQSLNKMPWNQMHADDAGALRLRERGEDRFGRSVRRFFIADATYRLAQYVFINLEPPSPPVHVFLERSRRREEERDEEERWPSESLEVSTSRSCWLQNGGIAIVIFFVMIFAVVVIIAVLFPVGTEPLTAAVSVNGFRKPGEISKKKRLNIFDKDSNTSLAAKKTHPSIFRQYDLGGNLSAEGGGP